MTQGGDRQPARGRAALATIRWSGAAILVAALHFAAAWGALNWRAAEATPDTPPPGVMIDLAPLPVAQPAPPQEVAPGPQLTEAQPVPTPDGPTPVDEPPDLTPPTSVAAPEAVKPDPAPIEPTQTIEERKPDIPQPAPPQDVKIPDLPKEDNAEATLAPPPQRRSSRKPERSPQGRTRRSARSRSIPTSRSSAKPRLRRARSPRARTRRPLRPRDQAPRHRSRPRPGKAR